jgi:ribosomal protein S18 acetylase RimI-like enzyme
MDAERETRDFIANVGVGTLRVDDLIVDDLQRLGWSGNRSHLRKVEGQLARAARGEVEYLAVRSPGGFPIAVGAIDYKQHDAAGTLFQLATVESLRGLGIGTRLIAEAERRIRRRGLQTAMVGVEDDNPRARNLYERLGYEVCSLEEQSWETEDERGNPYTKHARVILLRKELA